MEGTKPKLIFENLWQKSDSPIQGKVKQLWKKHFPSLTEEQMNTRLRQVVMTVRTPEGEVVGLSTAYKAYIKHLKNHLYAFRCFIDPAYRIPGLTEVIMVNTRDFLEEIHITDGKEGEQCIGMITLVENERIMKYRTEAIWPASKMVYIGNSPKGYHIRAYYFKKAMISLTPTFGHPSPQGEGKG
jgi:hypothetical protein